MVWGFRLYVWKCITIKKELENDPRKRRKRTPGEVMRA